jgi:hypothetical protein
MSTPNLGPDFDALAAFDPDIAGVVLDELLVGARPAYPHPTRAV